MTDKYYFAGDGNYGDANDLFICDTSNWDERDWMRVDLSQDYERLDVARQIFQENEEVR
jgi:hypothetical protein